ncbi:MAG: metallophosphoesterase family protein [Chitinophagales bacterium]
MPNPSKTSRKSQWAISDIHGCADTFRALVEEQIGLSNIETLYLLGDYVDRGPNSKGVFDYIFELRGKGLPVHCLMGNHEDLMLDSVKSPEDFELWMKNGGEITLDSFNEWSVNDIGEVYFQLIQNTQLFIELEHYWLVHAGFETADKNPFENRRMLLWKRNMEYDAALLKGKKVIHGHTPTPYTEIKEKIENEEMVISIDGGCVYKNRRGMGHLCALNLGNMDLVVQKNIDIIPEKPNQH